MRPAALAFAALCMAGCGGQAPDDMAKEGEAAMTARLDYFELPADDLPATKRFYEQAFGWSLTDFGDSYAATVTGDTDIGLASEATDKPAAPLPAIRTDDLEAALDSVGGAGGRIVKPIFAFPGGRRFEAVDPSGNRFAVYQPDAQD